MKKASIILLVVFLVASAFTGGFFLGRSVDRSEVRLSHSMTTTVATTAPATTLPPQPSAPTSQPSTVAPPATVPAPSTDNRININTASIEELVTLPNIGPVLAQRIVDYRKAHGSFRSIGELTEVEGIGEKRLEAILDYITIGG